MLDDLDSTTTIGGTDGARPMTAPSAGDLIRAVGLLADGPVPWGRPVRTAKPGVFLVELPAPLDRAPLDLALVGKWLERVEGLLVDGARPTSKALLARIARDWLPGQTVVFVGSTNGSLADQVAAVQATRPGDPLPCPDGLRLHLLRGIERCSTWWAETDAPEEYEDALLDAFAAGLDAPSVTALGGFGAPFAVLRRPTGEERPTGITGGVTALPASPAPPPVRVVDLPPTSAARQVGAPAPRAVARAGAPATGSVPGGRTAPRPGTPSHVHRDAPAPPAGARPAPAAPPARVNADGPLPPTPAPTGRPGADALHLSPEGVTRLEAELHDLRVVRRPEVVRRVATAREHGDLKENAEYHAAREELGFLDGRANAIEARLRSAIVVEAAGGGERATIGSTVVVEADGDEQTFHLVGSAESNLAAGRISIVSPVGKALVGVLAGDEVTVRTPAGAAVYRVVRVE
jgi:transcription elongation factor GreA